KHARLPYRFLVWAGTISYSIYLFHDQISWIPNVLIRNVDGQILPFILRTVVLALSIPLIAFIFRFVEAPFLSIPKIGDRIRPLYRRLQKFLGIKRDDGVPVPTPAVVP